MTATGAPGNTSIMPVTLKNAATPASATAATSATAPLKAQAGLLGGATASGAIGGAVMIGSAVGSPGRLPGDGCVRGTAAIVQSMIAVLGQAYR
jgi:hypothetical protein